MTVQTEAHRQGFVMSHDFHLIDSTVALHAGNTPIHVHGVIKIDVVRSLVNTHPVDRISRFVARTNRSK